MANSYYSFLIDGEGDVYGCGYNAYGQLAYNNSNNQTHWRKADISDVMQVDSGYYHTLFLKNDGTVWSCGYNGHGQLGISDGNSGGFRYKPVYVMDDVVQVSCGYYTSMALKSNGDVYVWGYSSHGEFGDGTNSSGHWQPRKVFSNAIRIEAGVYNNYIIDENGDLYAAGYNRYGGLGAYFDGNETRYWKKTMSDVIDVAAGCHHAVVLKTDGSVWTAGYNYYGQLGHGSGYRGSGRNYWKKIVDEGVIAVYSAHHTSYYLKENGDLHATGRNYYGQMNQGRTWDYAYSHHKVDSDVISLHANIYSILYFKGDGNGYTCGYNGNGQLGVGNTSNYSNARTVSVDGIYGKKNKAFTFYSNKYNTQTFHKENVEISVDIDHILNKECKYRILVNGERVFPISSEWTPMQSSPISIYKKIPSSDFNLGSNTIRIDIIDELNVRSFVTFKCERVNEVPSIRVNLSNMQVHAEDIDIDVNITELDDDPVQYKILLNDKQVYPTLGFTSLSKNRDFKWVFPNEQLDVGLNVIKIKYKDDLQLDEQLWTTQIIKINTNPSIIGDVKGAFINIDVDDTEKDRVKYKLLLDGVQIFPGEGYTGLVDTPFKIEYRIPNKFIKLNQSNTLTVEAIDSLNGTTTKNFVFTGVYSGLMFCDYDETWYSNDIGEVLKYLDFGTIIAGQITPAERVYIKNTLGYPVENIRISTRQGELDGANAKVEISQLDAPFMAQDILTFMEPIQHDEKISFFTRIFTNRQAHDGGMFDILVRADPTNKDNT